MRNFFCPLNPITDFRKLGTGRKRNKVVVANEAGRILFISEVRHNHDCRREVGFGNRKTFYMDSQHVDGTRVYLYLWCEELEYEWCVQSEVNLIEKWMKIASPKDIFAFAECVGLQREIVIPKYRYEILSEIAKITIRQHLKFLSLVELRRLTALLEVPYSSEPTVSQSTLQQTV